MPSLEKMPQSASHSAPCWVTLHSITGSGDESCLLFLNDCTSGQCHLVDSGVEVSLLLATMSDLRKKRKVPLFRRQMTLIHTYRTKTLSLDLGMDHKFTWIFIVADVSKPILGADFLCHSDLLINLACKRLTYGQTFSSTS